MNVGRGPTLAAAAATGARLLWVLEDGLTPAPRALDVLLEAADEPGAPPVIAGLVVDAAGAPVDRFIPRGGDLDLEALLTLAPYRRLAVRHVRGGHVLVRREAVEAHGLPDDRALGMYALAEWSARALGDRLGWLLTGSVATMPRDGLARQDALKAIPGVLRTACRARWTAGHTALALGDLARAIAR